MEVDAESERDAGGVSAADRVKEFAPEGAFIESLLRHASVRALIRILLGSCPQAVLAEYGY